LAHPIGFIAATKENFGIFANCLHRYGCKKNNCKYPRFPPTRETAVYQTDYCDIIAPNNIGGRTVVTKPEILEAMQFSFMGDKDPLNTSSSPRETITYQYAGTSAPVDLPTGTTFSGWTNFTAAEESAFEAALTHIESFLNVDFVEVSGSADPDLNVGQVTLPGSTTGQGGPSISWSGTTISRWDGFVVYDNTLDLSAEAQMSLLLHELGHALGLKHPFNAPALPSAEDSHKYSLMSYTDNPDNGIRSDAMMLYDVFALQDLWGTAAYQVGNSTYIGSRTDTVDTVWDTGGVDHFDASALTTAVALDLREGAFSTFSSYPDVVIAYGVEIENATGGSSADTIIGNSLANVLKGKGGNDTITAGAGSDTLKGGNGKDVLKGKNGGDTLSGDKGGDKLYGQNQNDVLNGGGGNDALFGGKGKDVLKGQAGNDKLTGNDGADRFVFAKGGDNDRIKDFADNVDEIKITGLGTKSKIISKASEIGSDVVFDFGNGDTLTVQNATIAQVSDDILT
jgi:serralysin